MHYQLKMLKDTISRLEKAVNTQNSDEVMMAIRIINNLSSEVYHEYFKDKHGNIKIQNSSTDRGFKKIAETTFLYKPMSHIDSLNNAQIDAFCKERTIDLTMSKTIDIHNEFWTENRILLSTIYGSVPTKIITEEQQKTLKKYGWLESSVDVIAFKKGVVEAQIRETVKANFTRYILALENSTKSFICFRFNIK